MFRMVCITACLAAADAVAAAASHGTRLGGTCGVDASGAATPRKHSLHAHDAYYELDGSDAASFKFPDTPIRALVHVRPSHKGDDRSVEVRPPQCGFDLWVPVSKRLFTFVPFGETDCSSGSTRDKGKHTIYWMQPIVKELEADPASVASTATALKQLMDAFAKDLPVDHATATGDAVHAETAAK
jgi:hypothetical protein